MADTEHDRIVIALWAATTSAIVMLSGHIVSRPTAFLLAPVVSLAFLSIARASVVRRKLFWVLTVGASIAGFIWAKYGYDRGHQWAILLGIGALAGIGWFIVKLVKRGHRQGGFG